MRYAVLGLRAGVGAVQRGELAHTSALWLQFGDQLLALAEEGRWPSIERAARTAGLAPGPQGILDPRLKPFLVIQKGRLFQQRYPDAGILLDKGRYLVVQLPAAVEIPGETCFVVREIQQSQVVFGTRTRAERRAPVAWVQNLVNGLSRTAFEATLQQIVSHPTRHSTSTHFVNAAAWADTQLRALGYGTRIVSFSWSGNTSRNVVAERLGSGVGTRSLVLLTAHLDSINLSGGASAPAPGADDNGTGSAGLLELARVLAAHPSVHDLRLVLFGGEEQGLRGSRDYVASLPPSDRARLLAVINMDMIGVLNTLSPTVLLEGAEVSRSLVESLAAAADDYTSLSVQMSFQPYASDHVPFIEAGLPAVLTIEGADSANTTIHSANDTLNRIHFDLAMEILRMNTAAVANLLGKQGGIMATFDPNIIKLWPLDPGIIKPWPRLHFSGKYPYNRGASVRQERELLERAVGRDETVLANPILVIDRPIYTVNQSLLTYLNRLRFTVHIDIDGSDPLNVVSGTVARGLLLLGAGSAPHFIGRVTSNVPTATGRDLVVTDFTFTWPGTAYTIDRLEISLQARSFFFPPVAQVTFVATGANQRFGPYEVERESTFFHTVEVEVDCEDGAVNPEPFDTHTHPDRPADLPRESLTLESAFAKSGIGITRSASSNVINTTEAGTNNRWNYQELHDAMESHWSAFANDPQWRMWIFLAELADDDSLGGVMFDGDIDEPGGVDRQGTAVFTLCPFFHTAGGDYPQANPPAAEAAVRELFFDLIHETGHAFNLAHSFQKTSVFNPGDVAWDAPAWMPVTNRPQSPSWMNYPDSASPGAGNAAKWFYDQFRFRFDDEENLFLRHAPDSYVQMGNSAWFHNHGRVPENTLDRRLALILRTLRPTVELGEPVLLELKLKNVSDKPVIVHGHLDPSHGPVEVAVTNPRGERRPFLPISQARSFALPAPLDPGKSLYAPLNLSIGRFGCPFKRPGPYRIEASFANRDGSTAAAVLHIFVRPPADLDSVRVASEMFNARVGRVLYVGGSRRMEDANDRIDWVRKQLGESHPASYFLATARALPQAIPYKLLGGRDKAIKLAEPDPEMVEQTLRSIVDRAEEAANSLGHITFRRTVDAYTDCALRARKKADARQAQSTMLKLFEARSVLASVTESVRQRVNELK
jgi:hypothetical protein